MKTYEQVLKKVELAMAKGEYHFCIQYLSPIIESFPLKTKEGVNLRTILITALCAINKKDDAKKFCKDLLKSYDYKTRENAKYLMEIIDSPEIKKPENWNITLESNTTLTKASPISLRPKRSNIEEKKFINITKKPTGETKPLQKGFAFIIFFILLLLIPLLSGCVKIENTLDLNELDSININLKVESKYINKFPWQIKFEDKIKDILPAQDISREKSDFYLKSSNLNLEETTEILKKIQKTAGDLANVSTNLEINSNEENWILFKKYNFKIAVDLNKIPKIEDLEIIYKIIHPNKATFPKFNKPQLEISKNLVVWNLIPGQTNILEFSFWDWNKLLIGITIISIVIMIAYLLRFYRFKLGTDLPQLPSD